MHGSSHDDDADRVDARQELIKTQREVGTIPNIHMLEHPYDLGCMELGFVVMFR